MGQVIELTLEKVLELIESAYPNPVTVIDLARWDPYYKHLLLLLQGSSIFIYCNFIYREHGWDPPAVEAKLKELQTKGVVKAMEHGAYTRVVHQDTQIQVNFISFYNIQTYSLTWNNSWLCKNIAFLGC